jgi:hypothetical protein
VGLVPEGLFGLARVTSGPAAVEPIPVRIMATPHAGVETGTEAKEPDIMRRKTFDILLTSGGLVVAIVLVVAGSLLLWGHNFANDNVRSQLAQQQITFPARGSAALASTQIGPYLNQYAGQQLLTGPQAKAYADHFIAVHLNEMPYNGVYSKVSAASMADAKNAALQSEVQTVFRGTTLRGLLLEAYAFWKMGQIALIGAVVSFILAGVMLVLTGFGFWHLRRVNPAEELMPQRHPKSAAPAVV